MRAIIDIVHDLSEIKQDVQVSREAFGDAVTGISEQILIFPFCAFSQDLCGFLHIPLCNLFTFSYL
jgi:hypothetical protein